MRCGLGRLVLSNLLGATFLLAQTSVPASGSKAMAEDGASYSIYSSLLPLGETGGKELAACFMAGAGIRRSPWCPRINPASRNLYPRRAGLPFNDTMNPHVAVHARTNGGKISMKSSRILTLIAMNVLTSIPIPISGDCRAPLRLLTPEEQKEFQSTRFGTDYRLSLRQKSTKAPPPFMASAGCISMPAIRSDWCTRRTGVGGCADRDCGSLWLWKAVTGSGFPGMPPRGFPSRSLGPPAVCAVERRRRQSILHLMPPRRTLLAGLRAIALIAVAAILFLALHPWRRSPPCRRAPGNAHHRRPGQRHCTARWSLAISSRR